VTIIYVIAGAVAVIVGGLLFTRSIEYLASRFGLTTSLVGAVISPILTSLPELTVIVVALIHGGLSGSEISIGTVIGEPFMASTIIYPMLIIVALFSYFRGRRERPYLSPGKEVVIPFIVFTVLFPFVLIPHYIRSLFMRYIIGTFLISSYVTYVIVMSRRGMLLEHEEHSSVVFNRFLKNVSLAAFLQLALSVILIYFGSELLVNGVIFLSKMFRIDPQLLSIVIVPSVSALPESVVGLHWAYEGKDTLAIESIVGEKVLYSTFYPGMTLMITDWVLKVSAIFCVLVTVLVSLAMIYYVYKGRIGYEIAGIGLAGYVIYVLLMVHVLSI